LESKGFGYSTERTNYLELRMKRSDFVAALLGIAVIVAVSVLKYNTGLFQGLLDAFPWADFS